VVTAAATWTAQRAWYSSCICRAGPCLHTCLHAFVCCMVESALMHARLHHLLPDVHKRWILCLLCAD
jgi:hypothetical protein